MGRLKFWASRILSRCRGIVKFCETEFREWYRAFLQAIPGEIGCALRNGLYGFRSDRTARVLSHVTVHCPQRLSIGPNTGIAAYCQLHAGGGLDIGSNVLIGPGVLIWSQSHRWESACELIRGQGWKRERVTIEDDVWIGGGALILPGVCLRKGTVVAAGAVVTRSTEPNTLVGGVPANRIGNRQRCDSNHA